MARRVLRRLGACTAQAQREPPPAEPPGPAVPPPRGRRHGRRRGVPRPAGSDAVKPGGGLFRRSGLATRGRSRRAVPESGGHGVIGQSEPTQHLGVAGVTQAPGVDAGRVRGDRPANSGGRFRLSGPGPRGGGGQSVVCWSVGPRRRLHPVSDRVRVGGGGTRPPRRGNGDGRAHRPPKKDSGDHAALAVVRRRATTSPTVSSSRSRSSSNRAIDST